MEATVKKGVFYGVGVGPGDPELLTLKAVRRIERCPVIAAPQTRGGTMLALEIAAGAVPMEGKTILPLSFPMGREPAEQAAAHQAAADQVEPYLAAGQDVAMLNLGDVSIYATFSYLMELIRKRGYETAMVPGIPSFCAVAAKLGISLTERDSALHIAPGGSALEETLELPGTKILMKSGRQLPEVLAALRKHGQLERSMLVKNCGLEGELVCRDLTAQLPEEDTGYFATIVVKE